MDWQKFDTLSKQEHGVLALRDARKLDATPEALSQYARRHGWLRPYPGVVLAPGIEHTFEQCCKVATVAAGGDRVLVSRLAAARLLGMTRERSKEIQLVVPVDRFLSLTGLTLPLDRYTVEVWRSTTLRQADAASRLSIPVTCAARTIIDSAAVLDLDDLRSLVIDARQRKIVRLADVKRVHERIARYPGRRNMTRTLGDLDEQVCDSRLEWDFRVEARARGFRPHPEPFPFCCSDGVVIEIDVAFPEAWVAAECDGLGSHAERDDLTRHHKRQNRAVADGWRPFLVDWTRLKKDPDGLFAELAALLATPTGRPPAPVTDRAKVDPRFRAPRKRRT